MFLLKVLSVQSNPEQDFLGDQNVTVKFHELKTHCEKAAVTPVLSESRVTPWLRHIINVVAMEVTQSQVSCALKHTLL